MFIMLALYSARQIQELESSKFNMMTLQAPSYSVEMNVSEEMYQQF